MAFVWFTPKDVLDKYPQFVPFTDFMASWNLQVRRMGEISGALNQANRFCSAVLWCVMPVTWIKLVVEIYYKRGNTFAPVQINAKGLLWLLGAPVFFYFAFWALPYPAETNRTGRFIFLNPLGRSLMIPGMVYLTGLLVLTWLRMATIWMLHMTGKNIR